MKKEIETLLECGAEIKIPYKIKIPDWYTNISIIKYNKRYLISGGPFHIEFYNVEDALNFFLEKAFSSINYGYVQDRLYKKNIIGEDTNIEHPNKKTIDIFKKEAKLVDEEFKKYNVNPFIFPNKKDAEKDLKKNCQIEKC